MITAHSFTTIFLSNILQGPISYPSITGEITINHAIITCSECL